jgi:hypothetical protein
LTLQNERETGREGVLRGRSDAVMTCSYDVEVLGEGEDDYNLLDGLRTEENISYEKKCVLLELIHKY